MAHESATALSPSSMTGTFSEPCGAIALFSVKRQGIDSALRPLCASAMRVRQQYGLNGRSASVPTSSNSFSDMPRSAPVPRSRPFLAYHAAVVAQQLLARPGDHDEDADARDRLTGDIAEFGGILPDRQARA